MWMGVSAGICNIVELPLLLRMKLPTASTTKVTIICMFINHVYTAAAIVRAELR